MSAFKHEAAAISPDAKGTTGLPSCSPSDLTVTCAEPGRKKHMVVGLNYPYQNEGNLCRDRFTMVQGPVLKLSQLPSSLPNMAHLCKSWQQGNGGDAPLRARRQTSC